MKIFVGMSQEPRQDAPARLAEQHGRRVRNDRMLRWICTHFEYKCTLFGITNQALPASALPAVLMNRRFDLGKIRNARDLAEHRVPLQNTDRFEAVRK